MIEINLLPHRESRRIADLRQTVAILFLGLVVAFGGIFFVARDLNADLGRAETNVRQLEAAIEQFKPQQAKVANFKKQRKRLEDKIDVIKGLERARTGPVRLFDELADLIPDRLWLESLKTKGHKITIGGSSLDTGIVADFLRSLNTSDYFSEVDLRKTAGGKDVGGVKLVSFEISAEFMNAKSSDSSKKGKG
jgi:type IV pilus assembly protein PilN